jgi:hypothetical protein
MALVELGVGCGACHELLINNAGVMHLFQSDGGWREGGKRRWVLVYDTKFNCLASSGYTTSSLIHDTGRDMARLDNSEQ